MQKKKLKLTHNKYLSKYISVTIYLLTLLLSGCASSTFGYRIHNSPNKNANEFALVVHASADYVVSIQSINGKDTSKIIRTISRIPTYLEMPVGEYVFGVILKGGTGPCGVINIRNEKQSFISLTAHAGKVYLLDRSSNFNPSDLCTQSSKKINVKFFFTELPALPYDDVRSSFVPIDLKSLPTLSK